ncbi:MAG: GNAT family N-acetyltransferase [Pseudomonadota bacterium]
MRVALETERLVLRQPSTEDFEGFAAMYEEDRSRYIGGPLPRRASGRTFGDMAGQWFLRGYGSFVLTRKKDGVVIGSCGLWHPVHWPECEFGWTLWSAAHEGHGYIAEAMASILPWAWERVPYDTLVSYIDAPNKASAAVAKRLGAELDHKTSQEINSPGGFYAHLTDVDVQVWRHRRPA